MNGMLRLLLILAIIALALFVLVNFSAISSLLSSLLSVLLPPLIGLALAFLLNIPLRALERWWVRFLGEQRKGLRRFCCLCLCLLFLFGAAALVLYTVLPQLGRTLAALIRRLPEYTQRLRDWYLSLCDYLSRHRFPLSLPAIPASSASLNDALEGFLEEHRHHLLRLSTEVLRATYRTLLNGLLGLVFSLYFLSQKEKLCAGVKRLLLALFSKESVRRILDFGALCGDTFSRFITGQLTEALLLGSVCFLGMLLFGMPYPLLISVIIAVTALVPVFGAIVGTSFGALLILLDSPSAALGFVVFILVLQQLETNLIYPRVVGRSVGLPGIWVLLAVTVGSSFGVAGLLLSVPSAAVLYCSLRQFVNGRLTKKSEAEP